MYMYLYMVYIYVYMYCCVCNPPKNIETCNHVPSIRWRRHVVHRLSAQQCAQSHWPRRFRPGFVPAWRRRVQWWFGGQWPLWFSTDGSKFGETHFLILFVFDVFMFSFLYRNVTIAKKYTTDLGLSPTITRVKMRVFHNK